MLGAIVGDIVGSRFEWNNNRSKDFEFLTYKCFPTDDSIMSLALAQAILVSKPDYSDLGKNAVECMQEVGRNYPDCGYGGSFREWMFSDNPKPYNSFGNGAAMRVSAAGFAASSLEEAKLLSKKITEVTHNHPEGIKGAEATAVAIFMAKSGKSMLEIRDYIDENYYPMNFTLDQIRPTYQFNETCQDTVPQALMAFIVTDGTVSWFNGISTGDLAFILHDGDVIGLWKLSGYKKEGEVVKALFEEIYGIEGLRTIDFIALTCFKLNIDLLNKSSKPSPGIGFFRLELEDRTIDELKDRETFEKIRDCRRKIYCCQCSSDAKDKARENPNDIILYKEAGKVELLPADFIEASLHDKFNNYKDFYEKSCRYDEVVDVCNKDPDANFKRSIKFIEEAFRNSNQVSEDMPLTTFYDLFFGETDYRLKRLGPPPKYYIMRHKPESPEEYSKIFEFAREHRFGLLQYDYREEQRSRDGSFRSVRTNLNKASNVKEGDVLFFQAYDGMIYAYGKVIPPRENADMTVEYPNEEINAINSSGKVIHFKDKMLYLDYKNYPFSSTDWPWGQRIDVDEWKNNGPEKSVSVNSGYDRSCFEEIDKNEAFRLMKLLGDDNMFEDECRSALEKVKNIVFTGAPGTGKTYFALKLAEEFAGDVRRVARVQFHPSYDYTDFVEGLRPIRGSAEISFERKDGIFKTICKKAKDDPENRYVLVIDEINRGDISKIFGELFSLIESDYRDEKNAVFTQYSNLIDESNPMEGEWEFQKFWVPENVFIIGTMNDIDRSVESMDFAIRRRFSWIEMKASEHLGMLGCLSDSEIRTKCISKMGAINEKISTTPGLGEAFEIGGSYFRHIEEEKGTEKEKFEALWNHYIGPVIKEYLRGFNSSTVFNEIKKAYDEA